ncbi:hypothetical protein BDB01DRAFT_722685 [Pilobolus umbonatus]|nr:hypothetical protein BDB01DRAFT_722685 [Pilobolus umbonatus]
MGPALSWLADPIEGYRIILIEKNTHYNHVFAYPRACVIPDMERELLIPYTHLFEDDKVGMVVNARAITINKDHVVLDREVAGFGNKIDYSYLVYAAGATVPTPGRFPECTKAGVIARLKEYQAVIAKSERPIIIGGGAVGIELASEIKERYPEKDVRLVHSRTRYLPRYKVSMDVTIYNILKRKGVKQVQGHRVVIPSGSFPLEVKPIEVQTTTGKTISGDLAILCIGMTPNSELMKAFAPDSINKQTGFVKVKPTMQIDDDKFTNIFAIGDVSDHTDVKTGHYAWMQGLSALDNIKKMIKGANQNELEPYKSKDLALIKMVLGKV